MGLLISFCPHFLITSQDDDRGQRHLWTNLLCVQTPNDLRAHWSRSHGALDFESEASRHELWASSCFLLFQSRCVLPKSKVWIAYKVCNSKIILNSKAKSFVQNCCEVCFGKVADSKKWKVIVCPKNVIIYPKKKIDEGIINLAQNDYSGTSEAIPTALR